MLRSSSIICNAILSSSSLLLVLQYLPPLGAETTVSGTPIVVGVSPVSPSTFWLIPMFFPSSIVITQLESEWTPALFCHTPICELSVSSLRQVNDGDGDLQHLRSFALSIAERAEVVAEDDDDDGSDPPSVLLHDSALMIGKLVLAFRPLIRMAASSYALAASSAVSNVPSHTLLFLHIQKECKLISKITGKTVINRLWKSTYSKGWRISETQEPQWRWRTPLNFFCPICGSELGEGVSEWWWELK